MFRRLLALCCAASFLIFAGACVLWVRSFRLADHFHWARTADRNDLPGSSFGKVGVIELETSRNRFSLLVETNSAYLDAGWVGFHHMTGPAADPFAAPRHPLQNPGLYAGTPPYFYVYFDQGGVAAYRDDFNDAYKDLYLIFPFWLAALLSGTPPALWVARLIHRRRRARAGFCPGCGYNLCATPRGCTECGLGTQ